MIKIFALALACLALTGCATIDEIRSGSAAKAIESLQLNPVQPDSYWYNGISYEYNAYKIKIVSKPVKAKIKWGDEYIGDTPLIYKFSGTLDKGDRINIVAVPMAENLQAQEATLKIRDELPREIHFDFDKK